MKEKTKDRIFLGVATVIVSWLINGMIEIQVNQKFLNAAVEKLEKSTQEMRENQISLNIAVRETVERVRELGESTREDMGEMQDKQEATNASVSALQEQQKATDDTVKALLKN